MNGDSANTWGYGVLLMLRQVVEMVRNRDRVLLTPRDNRAAVPRLLFVNAIDPHIVLTWVALEADHRQGEHLAVRRRCALLPVFLASKECCIACVAEWRSGHANRIVSEPRCCITAASLRAPSVAGTVAVGYIYKFVKEKNTYGPANYHCLFFIVLEAWASVLTIGVSFQISV